MPKQRHHGDGDDLFFNYNTQQQQPIGSVNSQTNTDNGEEYQSCSTQNCMQKQKQDLYRLFEKKSVGVAKSHSVGSNATLLSNVQANMFNVERKEIQTKIEQQHMKRSKSWDANNQSYSK